MLLVERHRAEPALKTDGLARPRVDEAGVEPARPRQRQRQSLAVIGA